MGVKGVSMILKYNKARVYDPKTFKNEVRRATKNVIKKSYVPMITHSRAWGFINRLPFVRKVLVGLIKKSIKLITLQSEENNGIALYDNSRHTSKSK